MTARAMPENWLLAAKIIAIAVLVDALTDFPDRRIPFVRVLDHVPAAGLRLALQLVFVVASVALLSNRFVRASAMVLGVVLIVAVLSSQVFFRYNLAFAGCLLFCLGFATRSSRRWLPSAQIAVLYVGATLNKLRSPNWRTGGFIRAWAPYRISGQRFLFHSSLPAGVVAKALSWSIMSIECFLLVVFAWRAVAVAAETERRFTTLWRLAALAGVVFHAGMYVVTGSTYGVFVFVILASFLVLLDDPVPTPWPAVCLVTTLAVAVVTRIDNATLVLATRFVVAVAVVVLAVFVLGLGERWRRVTAAAPVMDPGR